MPPSPTSSIAIIGASLTGLSFTLALLQHSLYSPANIKIYDLRNPDVPDPANSSGVVLTPNGLSILDSLGVLSRVRHLCWLSEYRTFKNDQDETVRKFLIANESLYGYKNHRLWRKLLLDALLTAVEERGVRIQWEAKFEGVRRESADHVTFVVNGREEMAGMLIGADGIYSAVRRDLDPEVGPEYTGVAGALSHIRRDEVTWPYEGYEKACTIQGKPGALVLMPEDRAGGVIMVAKQVRMEERSREQWDEFAHDKEQLCEFYRDRYEEWGETAKSIIDAVCRNPDTLYMWPFMKMARLQRWYSERGRVVIVGDAAHALPPSSGQGVNQALEDVYSLTKLLKSTMDLTAGLELWQQMRQTRIDDVFDWATNGTNIARLPQAERDELVRTGKAKDANTADDMSWLYEHKIDEKMDSFLETQREPATHQV